MELASVLFVGLLFCSVLLLVLLILVLRLHPFLALFFVSVVFGLCAGEDPVEVVDSWKAGFGGTSEGIGIIILLGSILGALLDAGGTPALIANAFARTAGPTAAPVVMGLLGLSLSTAVFADCAYFVLLPLCKELSSATGSSLSILAIVISTTLSASHTMVPPTPGPVLASRELQADLGLVLLVGAVVATVAGAVGVVWARVAAARIYIDPLTLESHRHRKRHNSVSLSDGEYPTPSPAMDGQVGIPLEHMNSSQNPRDGCDTGNPIESQPVVQGGRSESRHCRRIRCCLAVLAITVPMVMIGATSVAKVMGMDDWRWLLFLGDPVSALVVGSFLALLTVKNPSLKQLGTQGVVGDAIVAAGPILLITGSGGGFGRVLKMAGIHDVVEDLLPFAEDGTMSGLGTIFFGYFVAMLLKAAQGSGTVSLTITSSILKPMMEKSQFSPLMRALIVISVGAGAVSCPHLNDSFFWVLVNTTGMRPSVALALHTTGCFLMSIAAMMVLASLGAIVNG